MRYLIAYLIILALIRVFNYAAHLKEKDIDKDAFK